MLNIHKRTLNQPKIKVVELLETLASENDKIWPNEKWPPMKFKNGSLHNALIEDAFDKIENNFTLSKKSTEWNFWVKIFRKIMSRKRKRKGKALK